MTTQHESSTSVLEKEQTKLHEPKKYKVVMFNDDFTTMEFVTFTLIEIFGKSEGEAHSIMLNIHNKGKAIVGEYTKEIAQTKVSICMATAEKYEQPLLCQMIEE